MDDITLDGRLFPKNNPFCTMSYDDLKTNNDLRMEPRLCIDVLMDIAKKNNLSKLSTALEMAKDEVIFFGNIYHELAQYLQKSLSNDLINMFNDTSSIAYLDALISITNNKCITKGFQLLNIVKNPKLSEIHKLFETKGKSEEQISSQVSILSALAAISLISNRFNIPTNIDHHLRPKYTRRD